MELLKRKCPECKSRDIKAPSQYSTNNHGNRTIYKCEDCGWYFSETKQTFMEGLKTPFSLVWQVLNARTEGMSFNATTRVFGVAKNTILAWERRCAGLPQMLVLYSLVHAFLQLVIEGDEGYTRAICLRWKFPQA